MLQKYEKRRARQKFILAHTKIKRIKRVAILEIGALNAPTFTKTRANVRFADWFSREELKQHFPKKSDIEHVDYVINRTDLSAAIPDRFDLIIANHVIEHVPDVVTWLRELSKIATAQAKLFLAVPDRRYTFDLLRRESTIADILGSYVNKLDKPGFLQLFNHLYYHRKIVAEDIWQSRPLPQLLKKPHTVKSAFLAAMEMSKSYHSIHCNVFTKDGFVEMFHELEQMGLTPWRLLTVGGVDAGSNEFHVLLGIAE